MNISIVYEISKSYNISSYPTLKNCLFGSVSLTKNPDIDKYKYSQHGIGFDRLFWHPGVDMSSSTKIDNR